MDTNVLLDIATRDAEWAIWSLGALESAAAEGPLYLNAIIYAELSVRYDDRGAVDGLIEAAGMQFIEVPREAAFLAAKAFASYRSSGGTKTWVLPDFFIGAHAAVLDIPILTRDHRRYRSYFPDVRLLAPQMN